MYTLESEGDSRRFDTRTEAVKEAKRLSLKVHEPVIVHDARERESLVFKRGKLSNYVYETRKPRG